MSTLRTRVKFSALCKSATGKKYSRRARDAHKCNSLEADAIELATSTEIVKLNDGISFAAASETRTAEAIVLKIRAVEHMAVNNMAELKILIDDIENWQPCTES